MPLTPRRASATRAGENGCTTDRRRRARSAGRTRRRSGEVFRRSSPCSSARACSTPSCVTGVTPARSAEANVWLTLKRPRRSRRSTARPRPPTPTPSALCAPPSTCDRARARSVRIPLALLSRIVNSLFVVLLFCILENASRRVRLRASRRVVSSRPSNELGRERARRRPRARDGVAARRAIGRPRDARARARDAPRRRASRARGGNATRRRSRRRRRTRRDDATRTRARRRRRDDARTARRHRRRHRRNRRRSARRGRRRRRRPRRRAKRRRRDARSGRSGRRPNAVEPCAHRSNATNPRVVCISTLRRLR